MEQNVMAGIIILVLNLAVAFLGTSYVYHTRNHDKEGGGEDEAEYDVCEEHGHDLRDPKPYGFETKFKPVVRRYNINRGIISDAVPGNFLGVQYLLNREKEVCRDCDHEKVNSKTVEERIVFAKDGEVKTISRPHYEELAKEYQEEQE